LFILIKGVSPQESGTRSNPFTESTASSEVRLPLVMSSLYSLVMSSLYSLMMSSLYSLVMSSVYSFVMSSLYFISLRLLKSNTAADIWSCIFHLW